MPVCGRKAAQRGLVDLCGRTIPAFARASLGLECPSCDPKRAAADQGQRRVEAVEAQRHRATFYAAAIEGGASEADLFAVDNEAAEVAIAHAAAPGQRLTLASPDKEGPCERDFSALQGQGSQ